MPLTETLAAVRTFDSRLATLSHLLKIGAKHLNEAEAIYLGHRLAPDMLPLGTQVAFTCNQPRNFALWLAGTESADLEPNVDSLAVAEQHIADTRTLLASHVSGETNLPSRKHLELGVDLYADLTGQEYLKDFLMPNFYFHLVTSYAILRNLGIPVGKRDYMLHLIPKVQQRAI
ncbi:MAG: DUF1993 domain-containing protein [Candidatus Competibacteraceae bacterium]|jgi:hypothetical protein|nr:DUF1993 domain-containing protein [Candidatus Competibacteraceae bacterium]